MKHKVTEDKYYTNCPTYHFIKKEDRVKKIGSSTWQFAIDSMIGNKASRVADDGYHIQKFNGIQTDKASDLPAKEWEPANTCA